MSKKIDITPTANILHSLTRTGYHWSQALMDIIDNSVDALRERYILTEKEDGFIRITPRSSKKSKRHITETIVIADNGTGIDEEQLKEILRLGESGKRGMPALGTFGMGLKTAAMSLGSKLSILSTTSDIEHLRSITWDVKKCMESGKFEADYNSRPSRSLINAYKEIIGGDCPGTLVIIGDLHEGIPTLPAIIQTINAKCAHAYRHLLNTDSPLGYYFPFKITAGQTDAAAPVKTDNDPLCLSDARTQLLIGGEDGSFQEVTYGDVVCHIRMSHFHDEQRGAGTLKARQTHGLGKYMGGSHKQGVYWIREGREICCSSFWSSSPVYSNVYAEVAFSDAGIAGTSNPIRMDFGKKGVELDDQMHDYLLKHIFKPHLDAVQKSAKARAKKAKKSDRNEIMKKVAQVKLPTEQFGRGKTPKKDRHTKAIENIFKPAKTTLAKRKNSKYRGTSIEHGTNELHLEFEELTWPGSSLPYCIEYTAGDPVCKIQLNLWDKWVEKNIYLNEDAVQVARNLQLVAANAVALMWEDAEKREELYIKQGALLHLFDDDFGRVEDDLETVDLPCTVEPSQMEHPPIQ